MMQAQVKSERPDTYGSSYHYPFGLTPQEVAAYQARMAPPNLATIQQQRYPHPQAAQRPPAPKPKPPAPPDNLESLPDFASIKGIFGWTMVDGANIPYILRNDKKFVSVRMVEQKLLSKYPNSYPDDLGKHQPLTSFFVTVNEAKLLNEINFVHCGGEFGQKEFNTKDLIVLLSDFENFYGLVKKTFPENGMKGIQMKKEVSECCGWLQINNTVTPYLKRPEGKCVPLSVIRYAAGLLTNIPVKEMLPSQEECDLLNKACQVAGFTFTFAKTTKIVPLSEVTSKEKGISLKELPPHDPFQHAQYMDLPCSKPNLEQNGMKNHSVNGIGNYGRNTFNNQRSPMSLPTKQHQTVNQPRPPQGVRPAQAMPPQNHMQTPNGVNPYFPPPFPGQFDPRFGNMYDPSQRFPPSAQFQRDMNTSNRWNTSMRGPPNVSVSMQQPPQQQALLNGNTRARFPFSGPVPMDPSQMGMARYPSQPQRMNQSAPSPGAVTRKSPATGQISKSPHGNSRPPSASQPSQSPTGRSPVAQVSGGAMPQQGMAPFPFGYHPNLPPNMFLPRTGGMSVPQAQMNGQAPAMFPPPNQNMIPSMDNVPQQNGLQTMPIPMSHAPQQVSGAVNMSWQQQKQQEQMQQHINRTDRSPMSGQTPLRSPDKPKSPSTSRIPGLYSPPKSVSESVQSSPIPVSSSPIGAPPPLTMMAQVTPPGDVNTTASPTIHVVQPVSVTSVQPDDISKSSMEAPVSSAPTDNPFVNAIKGAWLNGKSISCLHLETPNRKGRYCLVEAVCKLYFNGCSVNEFLFALENVLHVPSLLTCNDEEEKAFIQYYSLPVTVLKCNKMISFDDLEQYFPQLSYMFPDKSVPKPAETELNGMCDEVDQENSSDNNKDSDLNKSPEYVAVPLASLNQLQDENKQNEMSPTRVAEKRAGGSVSGGPAKHPKLLEATVERLRNQQHTEVSSESDISKEDNNNTVGDYVIVLD